MPLAARIAVLTIPEQGFPHERSHGQHEVAVPVTSVQRVPSAVVTPRQEPDRPRPPRCRCGATYDPEGWLKLPYVGVQRLDGETSLELRHCAACSNTITRPIRE
jgi:hypothetical protein